MNKNAVRNKYRGLMRHIRDCYDYMGGNPTEIHFALQEEAEWKGVSQSSVNATVSRLRAVQKSRNAAHPGSNGRSAKNKRLPDMLITLPLSKKQTAIITLNEAQEVYLQLHTLFGK